MMKSITRIIILAACGVAVLFHLAELRDNHVDRAIYYGVQSIFWLLIYRTVADLKGGK